ncbi:MAG: hypothetical protein Q8K70_11330 [Bacteroidota bacterium]|nr:hypothetical protein [Bacteroidota bacterium]
MKKHLFLISLLVVSSTTFAQQFLWSTVLPDSGTAKKYVPLENVETEVLTFYDQYPYYFDLSGYNKQRFIKEITFGFDDWTWLNKIETLTVFAYKSNTGQGSVIMLLCVSKDNVNLLLFSNDIMAHKNPQSTSEYERGKFMKWFKTLLN